MIQGAYVGPIKDLVGKTALMQYERKGYVLVQFDEFDLIYNKVRLSHGWHEFNELDFKIVLNLNEEN